MTHYQIASIGWETRPFEWKRRNPTIVKHLKAALLPDYVVLGGGNVNKLKTLPPKTRMGDNDNAFLGGFKLWKQ